MLLHPPHIVFWNTKNLTIDIYTSLEYSLWFTAILKSLTPNIFFNKPIRINAEFTLMEKQFKKKEKLFCFFFVF